MDNKDKILFAVIEARIAEISSRIRQGSQNPGTIDPSLLDSLPPELRASLIAKIENLNQEMKAKEIQNIGVSQVNYAISMDEETKGLLFQHTKELHADIEETSQYQKELTSRLASMLSGDLKKALAQDKANYNKEEVLTHLKSMKPEELAELYQTSKEIIDNHQIIAQKHKEILDLHKNNPELSSDANAIKALEESTTRLHESQKMHIEASRLQDGITELEKAMGLNLEALFKMKFAAEDSISGSEKQRAETASEIDRNIREVTDLFGQLAKLNERVKSGDNVAQAEINTLAKDAQTHLIDSANNSCKALKRGNLIEKNNIGQVTDAAAKVLQGIDILGGIVESKVADVKRPDPVHLNHSKAVNDGKER